jgi:glutathione S-transferase
VICEYLNSAGDGHLLPARGPERWRTLVDQSLADGMMDAAILTRYETVARPESLRWSDWITGQFEKIHSGLAQFEQHASALASRVDIGTITLGCALGYLDFRFATLPWRDNHPALARWYAEIAKRESFAATQPA